MKDFYIKNKNKLCNYICLSFLLLGSCLSSISQNTIFETTKASRHQMNQKSLGIIEYYESQANTNRALGLIISNDLYNAKTIVFNIDGNLFSAQLINQHIRDGNKDFTWFGKLDDDNGVFFTVKDGKIASKFSVNGLGYTLIPTSENNHVLVEFNDTHVGTCGNDGSEEGTNNAIEHTIKPPVFSDDSGCTLRVLIATTPVSRNEIAAAGFDNATFAQMAIDEANMAYVMSNIDITMELAVLLETNYVESLGNQQGVDVNRFRDGVAGLAITHIYREMYRTDIQILLRRNESGIFGRAFYIPTTDIPLSDANAYCTVSINGVTTGRFSFTHEVGHLQGGKHDNDNRAPLFARGFATEGESDANITEGVDNITFTTIMTVQGAIACTQGSICREGVFSNPDITVFGIPAGTNTRNNALRLRQTSDPIRNNRIVPNDLLLDSETIPANYVSNHLGRNSIDTDNKVILYQNNSKGTLRAETSIVLKPGVLIQRGAAVRVFVENNTCGNAPDSGENPSNEDKKSIQLDVVIFPNPTPGIVNLSFKEEVETYTIELFSFNTGVKVFSEEYKASSKNEKVNIDHLKPGTYILKVISDNQIITKQIVKN